MSIDIDSPYAQRIMREFFNDPSYDPIEVWMSNHYPKITIKYTVGYVSGFSFENENDFLAHKIKYSSYV